MKRIISLVAVVAMALAATALEFTDGNFKYYSSGGSGTLTATVMGFSATASTDAQTNVVIPPNASYGGYTYLVEGISTRAFKDNTKIVSVTLPYGMTVIGTEAFKGCTGLTELYLPSSIASILSDAFNGCGNNPRGGLWVWSAKKSPPTLQGGPFANAVRRCLYVPKPANVGMPTALTPVGLYRAADGWKDFPLISDRTTQLGDVVVKGANNTVACYIITSTESTKVNGTTYSGTAKAVSWTSSATSCTIPNYVTYTGLKYAVTEVAAYFHAEEYRPSSDASKMTAVTAGANTSVVGDAAFEADHDLVKATFPGVLTIRKRAFKSTKLQSMLFGDNGKLETIGDEAFQNCSELENIEMPSTVTSIGNYAFSFCDKLTQFTLPAGIYLIGDRAFNTCNKLRNLYAYMPDPTTVATNTETTFGTAVYEQCVLHVPKTSVSLYKANKPWFYFNQGKGIVGDLGDDPQPITGKIWIGDEEVTADNCGKDAIVEGVTVNLNTATVTMENVYFSASFKGLVKTSVPDLTIKLIGENKAYCAYFLTATDDANVTIVGVGDATLEAWGTQSGIGVLDFAEGGDCVIKDMANIYCRNNLAGFRGKSGSTVLTLDHSTGSFIGSSATGQNAVSNVKDLVLKKTKFTNCDYVAGKSNYGNRGQLDFEAVEGGGEKYDVNGDGHVDVGDVNTILGDILATGGTTLSYDVNGDGRVDVGDVNTILAAILAQ